MKRLLTFVVLGFASVSLRADDAPAFAASLPAYHGRFAELPVGAVQPRGWIRSWLARQAEGLTGHPENLAYPYDTAMFAGKIPPPAVKHGETWWPYEQSGYFVDGVVRLNREIEDPGLARLATANLGYLRENSGPGKFGESTWAWPNTVVGRALMAEHSATHDAALARVLRDYFSAPRPWRSRDGYVFEEALYVYGQTGEPALLDFARAAYDRFFLSDPRSFSHVDKIRGAAPLREHGVTAAEQLKLLPLMYCFTGEAQALELANLAYRKVEADSLMPDGGMVSAESLGTTAFNSLHETCDLTDWSWSFGYLLLAGGEVHWADLIEQTTFNALPGAVTKDFKQLQYFSSANQILASDTACPRIAPTRMSYRAAHDTECCSGNVNRAMPNYVARMWLKMDGGIAAALYGPCELRTIVAGQPVVVTEETDYPFRTAISFRIKLARPAAFALALRIPEWCAAAVVTVNGAKSGVPCQPGTFAMLQREFRDGDTIALQLPMIVRLKEWFAGRSVSVQRGPLVYSLEPGEKRVESREDPEPIKRVLKGNNIAGFPAVEFFPAGEWRYGIDSATKAAPEKFKVVESPMTDNPFLAAATPVRIEVPLRALPRWEADWKPTIDPLPADLKTAPKNPASLPSDAELQPVGDAKAMTLIPYGATHLRLTTLPVIEPVSPAR
ncbi:MAG TPA: beta-L-arabinofuranosidase domain-containing protein [Opitutaceae bacterium]|nr:beta-L-arabinofuranosidase domain-containing protein [Opitutaceae bacterium]